MGTLCRSIIKHVRYVIALAVLLVAGAVAYPVAAQQIESRYVRLGTSEPAVETTHTFSFNNLSSNLLGSIEFEYCENSPLRSVACNAPNGFDATTAVLDSQTGNGGFSISAVGSSNRIVLTRSAAVSSVSTNEYSFSHITNPSEVNKTVYIRIGLYALEDAQGAPYDEGAVAFSTSGQFNVGAYVPPILVFCVGVVVADDCSSTQGSLAGFGELSSSSPSVVTTQFAAATNGPTGLSIYLNGQTMTSGNNTIPALLNLASSTIGTSQFGINLRANAVPLVGAEKTGNGTIVPANDFGVANQFRFTDGGIIARSPVTTDFNRFTVSYLVNVSEAQRPGVYATVLLYTAITSF